MGKGVFFGQEHSGDWKRQDAHALGIPIPGLRSHSEFSMEACEGMHLVSFATLLPCGPVLGLIFSLSFDCRK